MRCWCICYVCCVLELDRRPMAECCRIHDRQHWRCDVPSTWFVCTTHAACDKQILRINFKRIKISLFFLKWFFMHCIRIYAWGESYALKHVKTRKMRAQFFFFIRIHALISIDFGWLTLQRKKKRNFQCGMSFIAHSSHTCETTCCCFKSIEPFPTHRKEHIREQSVQSENEWYESENITCMTSRMGKKYAE